jgi:hypothetical protein
VLAALLMVAAPLLAGCDARSGAFRQVDGGWRYKDTPIPDADPRTFAALDDHYAKDRSRVYHADTYRDGKEYFMIAHDRVAVVAGADPASFAVLGRGYAKDAANVYLDGARVAVRDPRTFELLEDNFARDRTTGYYLHGEVAGSDGATFAAIGNRYAKDAARVYFADLVIGDGDRRPYVRSAPLPGAQGATFRVLDAGYAADAGQAYYRDQVLSRDVASFAVLAFDYAKTSTEVYHRGAVIPGADAATFATFDAPTDAGDARDAKRTYAQGRPVQAR